MIVIGLTGSIGMGKTTTARLFGEEGAAVWDADAAVHELYAPGGAAVAAVSELFPGVADSYGVDRAKLRAALDAEPTRFKELESVVHPMVAAHRAAFLQEAREAGVSVAVLDIPLLFETGGDRFVDAVVVASAPSEVQAARVLARPGMTPERFADIRKRQTPDAEKRRRADFVIETGGGIEPAREQVRAALKAVSEPGWTRKPPLSRPRKRPH